MNYKDFNNDQISYIVSTAIACDNYEEARRNFTYKYEKEVPLQLF